MQSRLWTVGTVLMLGLLIPVNLFGESLVRSISLEANDARPPILITTGTEVRIQNNYTQVLYQTSVVTETSNQRLLSIEAFHPGQSFGLEFTKKGPYSVCYSLKQEKNSGSSICLQINVVPLQTA